jgi:hypothetical protein
MTDEERTIITQFVQRVSGVVPAVPGSAPPALAPIDPQADQLIGELFTHFPEARYRLTQTAFVQDAALKEAHSRLQALETELQSTRAALQAAQAQSAAAPPPRSGFFSSVFGGAPARPAPAPMPAGNPWGQPAAQPMGPPPGYPQQPPGYPPQPQYAPAAQGGMMGGMMSRSGSGFLGSALTTAAGVAGGVVAGNALMNLFEGHNGGMGGGFGGGLAGGGFGAGAQPVNETIINNYGDAAIPGGYDPSVQPDNAGYQPWGGSPDAAPSEALNDGYWPSGGAYPDDTAANMPDSGGLFDDTDQA